MVCVKAGRIEVGCEDFADELRQSDDFRARSSTEGNPEIRVSGPLAYIALYAALCVPRSVWPRRSGRNISKSER